MFPGWPGVSAGATGFCCLRGRKQRGDRQVTGSGCHFRGDSILSRSSESICRKTLAKTLPHVLGRKETDHMRTPPGDGPGNVGGSRQARGWTGAHGGPVCPQGEL